MIDLNHHHHHYFRCRLQPSDRPADRVEGAQHPYRRPGVLRDEYRTSTLLGRLRPDANDLGAPTRPPDPGATVRRDGSAEQELLEPGAYTDGSRSYGLLSDRFPTLQ